MGNSKNDCAWKQLFDKYRIPEKILRDGHAEISAVDINEFREARLMAKFDHKSQLPKLFSDNNLSILPTSRGGYIIGNFEAFHNFNKDDIEVSTVRFPQLLESLDYRSITSEATAINCAFASGILRDFTGEENLVPTVSGRMSSSRFSFDINSAKGLLKVNVENSQVEIDGGYEGDHSLCLIEAKNYISDDFLVRQLYYPFRLWSGKVKKRVRPIYLTYTNGVFHLREYAFRNVDHYNSLELIRHRKYTVQEETFNLEVLLKLIARTKPVREPEMPFPQADSFERVINLCELLKQKEFLSNEEITHNYDFHTRQTSYYSNAGKYLGLVDMGKHPATGEKGCFLTQRGKQIFALSLADRQKEFVKLIVAHSVFRQTLELYLEKGASPDRLEIVAIMKQSDLYRVGSDSTYFRRASTIAGWVDWIIELLTE